MPVSQSTSDALLDRIRNEYTEGQDFLRTKKQRQVRQLVLMNNLRRGDENIASTMLFSTFNRVHSDLYDDSIQVKFVTTEDSDYKKMEGLNKMAVSDYREMDKARLDHDWNWDALFFGRGYMETLVFDRERLLMAPHVINPLVLVYDPYFADPQDWRYYGKWVLKSRYDLIRLINKGVLENIASPDDIAGGVEDELWDYKVKRDAAKEAIANPDNPASPSGVYQLLEHFTHDEDGDRSLVWLDKNFSKIVRIQKLNLRDGPEGTSRWPIVPKEVFREPHSTAAVSIPDIVEDKHRALNVLLNLAYLAGKDEANPIYAYNKDAIDDVTQLFQRQIQQHIGVTGDPGAAIKPLRNAEALTNSLLSFITILKSEGAEAVGTTQLSAPMPKGRKTASEAALLQQVVDLTKSLQSKIMARAEEDFWSHWYWRYRRNMRETDKKLISLTSVTGFSFESLTAEDIRTKFPPKVQVLSAKEAEFKETVERRDLMTLMPVFGNAMDTKEFRNFLKFVFLPKFQTIDSSTVDTMLPKGVDEIQAEQENALLEADDLPDLRETDDDEVHLYVHARAKNTPAKWAHYLSHEEQLAKKRALAQEQAQAAQSPTPEGPAAPPPEAAPGLPEPPLKAPASKSTPTQEAAIQ